MTVTPRTGDRVDHPEADRATVVRCTDVGRTFGTGTTAVVALHGVTASVRAGDRIAITGPSGSGKSTLLHLLSGLDQPTVGSVEWPGSEPGHDRNVGLVFQTPSLIPSLSVRENVELPMLLNGSDAADATQRAEDALALVQLAGLAHRLPQELSGGQAQRVVIARVLAARPAVILADEPTSKLDRGIADHVAASLVEASAKLGAALVVATHDRAVADRFDTEWPIRDGRLVGDTAGRS